MTTTIVANSKTGFSVDKWRDQRYLSRRPSNPFVQWNAKQIKKPPFHITLNQAQEVGWIGEPIPGWQQADFTYEATTDKPEVTDTVLQTSKPILAIVKIHRSLLVYRKDNAALGHRKYAIKPANEPYSDEFHVKQNTYVVGVLAHEQNRYRLLHEKPLFWTPKGVPGARFGLEIYKPFRNAINSLLGEDVPSFLFALHLESKVETVGSADQSCKIHVPYLEPKPGTIDEFQSLYVGDQIAETCKSWYDHLVKASESNNVAHAVIDDLDMLDY